MTKVVDLAGKVITEPIPATTPLSVLKEIVAEIEAGTSIPEKMLVLTMSTDPKRLGCVIYESWTNQLTMQEKLWLLEMAKVRLMSGDED